MGRPLAFLSCDWRFQKVVSKSVRALAEILGTFCAQNPGDRDDFRVIFWEVESAYPAIRDRELEHSPDSADPAEPETRTPGRTTLTAHAFRIT